MSMPTSLSWRAMSPADRDVAIDGQHRQVAFGQPGMRLSDVAIGVFGFFVSADSMV